MELTTIGIIFVLGIIVGIFLHRQFRKEKELNTDMCMDYLKERGYFVNLNMVQNK